MDGVRVLFSNERVFDTWGPNDYSIRPEVLDWLVAQLGVSLNNLRIQHCKKDGYADFEFTRKDTALLFKLTFGGA